VFTLPGVHDAFVRVDISCPVARNFTSGVCWYGVNTALERELYRRSLVGVTVFVRPVQPDFVF
jgi:hypothetical protein